MGKFTRFISNTVMIGFLTGVAVLVILGQLGDLTGYESELSGAIVAAADTLLHPGDWDRPTLATGLVTIALILLFSRTRLKNFSMVLAMVIGTAVVLILSLESVTQVGDATPASGSIPTPVLPDLSLITELAIPAVAIGLVSLSTSFALFKAVVVSLFSAVTIGAYLFWHGRGQLALKGGGIVGLRQTVRVEWYSHKESLETGKAAGIFPLQPHSGEGLPK